MKISEEAEQKLLEKNRSSLTQFVSLLLIQNENDSETVEKCKKEILKRSETIAEIDSLGVESAYKKYKEEIFKSQRY